MPSTTDGYENPKGDSWWSLNLYDVIDKYSYEAYNKSIAWPLNYGPTGGYGGSIYNRLDEGEWWLATGSNYDRKASVSLAITPYGVGDNYNNSFNSGSRGRGHAIRCVVRS